MTGRDGLGWALAGFLAANQLWMWLAGHGDRSEIEALQRRIDQIEEQVYFNQNPLAQQQLRDTLRQLDELAEEQER
jgi:hypothetical protein